MEAKKYPGTLVFGLDIGTRSIVGTVGYKIGERFHVVDQEIREHETRAMLDGQIHDIRKVGNTILSVKEALEERLGRPLKDVCIAAAGRVLRTVTVHAEQTFEKEKEISEEDIYALTSMGIENAYKEFNETADGTENTTKFYCVGYSVIRFFLNGYPMGNLEGHKAREVACDLIATFLPDDVVDGLYKAVGVAGLEVANLTLEPIAAIQVAIPQMYRMLNIALVDVGAGTSDISITRDGSIIAYGMIPVAGDALTEIIAQNCLVDFNTAEQIKRQSGEKEEVEYKDIMGLPQVITREQVAALIKPVVDQMTGQVADKIKELNGDKSVSAVFVVGGGGMIAGYTQSLAEHLGIQRERVAVRGQEVMQQIEFLKEDAKKDSLMVTPIGICLSFYEQSNSFIFVYFNKQRIKIYDNNHLAVVDAAVQAEFPNDGLFPKRGKELNFTINGQPRMQRGEPGEAAVIFVNGYEADIHTAIHANDVIEVKESTAGAAAHLEVGKLPEYQSTLRVKVNDALVEMPRFVQVNGILQSGYYAIQEGDVIEILNYYTVEQLAAFMDLSIEEPNHVYVNNRLADAKTQVYENFSVEWKEGETKTEPSYIEPEEEENTKDMDAEEPTNSAEGAKEAQTQAKEQDGSQDATVLASDTPQQIAVMVNGKPVILSGKKSYVFVDVFDWIDFDLSKPQGRGIVTKLNDRDAQYMEELHQGDKLEIYWRMA